MEIKEERHDGILLVAPRGRVDSNTSGRLEDEFSRRVGAGERNLLVDMAGIDYISSAGLRVFLLLAKKLQQAGGRLVLSTLHPAVKQVFDLAGLTPLFTVEPSTEAGLARLRSS